MRGDVDIAESAVVDALDGLNVDVQHCLEPGPEKHAHAVEEGIQNRHASSLHDKALSVYDLGRQRDNYGVSKKRKQSI